jgi:hypothetical protein
MSIGFKEWALVCNALGTGAQSIILRKGGIAEGREGFRFKHDALYLFPTLFHEQLPKTKLPVETPLPVAEHGLVRIRLFARVEWTRLIVDPAMLPKLAPFHIWTDEVIEERFRYDEVQGVNLAFLRVFQLDQDWTFPDDPKYGGCRSWVILPDFPETIVMKPVLDDMTHADRQKQLLSIIGPSKT